MERQTRNVVIDRANDGDQEFTIQAWAKNGAGVLSINHGPLQGTEAFERLEADVRESARIVQDGGAERLVIQRSAELGIAYGPTTLRFPYLITEPWIFWVSVARRDAGPTLPEFTNILEGLQHGTTLPVGGKVVDVVVALDRD